MREAFLHYIWKNKLLEKQFYRTSSGEEIELIYPGIQNFDSGPDFFNARVRIGKITWAGNVEIHYNASDWISHGHTTDNAYNSVILHVVYNDDSDKYKALQNIETLEIKDKFKPSLYNKYNNLNPIDSWIPCETNIERVNLHKSIISRYLRRLFDEKIDYKVNQILQSLNNNRPSMEQAFYQSLLIAFGFKTNALPFELLARSLPYQIVNNHKNDLMSIEALFFGQAGFLNDKLLRGYPKKLSERYQELKTVYGIQSMDKYIWKFLRMRPGNFPTMRLASLSALMCKNGALFDQVIKCDNLRSLKELFKVTLSKYWINHFHFGKLSKRKVKGIGDASIDSILINSVLPFLIVYGQQTQNNQIITKVMTFFDQIDPEVNKVTKRWKALNMPLLSAVNSQALLWLKHNYCDHKKCLSCKIGHQILNANSCDK